MRRWGLPALVPNLAASRTLGEMWRETGVDGLPLVPYSRSIVNEPAKLLICIDSEGAVPIFSVIFTANSSRSSIGAGFRAVSRKLTLRDLSPPEALARPLPQSVMAVG